MARIAYGVSIDVYKARAVQLKASFEVQQRKNPTLVEPRLVTCEQLETVWLLSWTRKTCRKTFPDFTSLL